MSILKTTKAGKSAVNITKEYLLSRGWTTDEALMYAPKKEYNKNDLFLRICNYVSDDETTFELRLSTFQKVDDRPPMKQMEYLYTIPIKTVRDLELLENFWYTKATIKKRKYKKQLLAKATKTDPVSSGHFWWYK
jgi:hypothetical protein